MSGPNRVCSPPFKRGNQILKLSKRGGPNKNFGLGETKRAGKVFNNKRGNPTFKAEFRDRKEQKMRTFRDRLA